MNRRSYLCRFSASIVFPFVICLTAVSQTAPAVPVSQTPPAKTSSTDAAPQSAPQAVPTVSAVAVDRQITGTVKSGNTALPGVTVSAANTLTGKKVFTSTDVDGSFKILLSSNGRYVVRAELVAFAPATKEVIINAATPKQVVDVEMLLASRAQVAAVQQQAQAQQAINALTGRGFQNLGVTQSEGAGGDISASGGGDNSGAGLPASAMGGDAATESVSVTGAQGRTEAFGLNFDQLQDRIQAFRDRAARGDFGGGPGGGGFGDGGFGGGGRQVFTIGGPGGGIGRFNINQPHGAITYNLGDSVFDANAYSLNGRNAPQASYAQHRISGLIGGPLKIPHIYDGGTKTFYFISYFGFITSNPFDQFATVPTLAERAGDFSQTRIRSGPNAGQLIQIINPQTGLPFPGNMVPQINSAAAGLLAFIPTPNLPGDVLNFHRVTSTDSLTHNLNLRLTHNFSSAPMRGQGGGGAGRRDGAGAGGGPRNNISIGFNYRTGHTDVPNISPGLGNTVDSGGYNFNVAWTRSLKRVITRTSFTLNAARTDNTNIFAGLQNVEGGLGINGASTDPFDYGVPTLSFTNFTGLRDNSPLSRHDLTWSLGENASWNHGKHNIRFGGDFRRIHLNLRSSTNPRGSFTFNGSATGGGGSQIAGTGFDFADFLLGLPQLTSIQFSSNEYHFLGNSWDMFVQDDWRILPKLTLNLGLRYEYVSPYSEADDRLVNLDAPVNFTAVAPVFPGGVGPFTGVFPATLVNPDRNNFAPRIGIAWNVREKYVVRAGYGIGYNTGAYSSFVQQLAFQPPFAFTETNTAAIGLPLTLQNGFPAAPASLTNNFGVDRGYRMGYVQTWNLDIQHQFSTSLVMNIGYTGTKGTHLDLERAPDRGPTGLTIPGIEPFLWESSQASSTLHAGNLRVRKRLQHGFSVGGTYTYSKSIDNASTIGGGAVVVAQNDLDLAAERGLSSFDQRHRLTTDYIVELPFGTNKRWLARPGLASKIFGDWTWSGGVTLASGFSFTPRVLGSAIDLSEGINGSIRADLTGQPISLDNKTIDEFFNTAAFVAPPPGQFGDSRRNVITGPGTVQFDMSMGKNFPLKETRAFEVRATATNVFNHPNFASIDTVVNSPTFGRVVGIGTMRRIQMLARYRF